MDETKTALPAWLPWATTACLAALAAGLGELLVIERTRSQLARDESLLSQASLQASRNQLEAERILSKREMGELRAHGAELLTGPGSGFESPFQSVPWGVASWDVRAATVFIRFSGLPDPGAGGSYQLWIDGSGVGYPLNCGMVSPDAKIDSGVTVVHLKGPVPPGYRILLIDGIKGGADTLDEAEAKGSIILASLRGPGKISN